jgi:hypothetical protein
MRKKIKKQTIKRLERTIKALNDIQDMYGCGYINMEIITVLACLNRGLVTMKRIKGTDY